MTGVARPWRSMVPAHRDPPRGVRSTLHPQVKEGAVIDMVRDYAAIGVGTAQATTTRAVVVGRAGVDRLTSLGRSDTVALPAPVGSLSPREAVGRGREAVSGILSGDVDSLIGRLGLAKKSELHAVRQQIHRLERRLGEVRGER